MIKRKKLLLYDSLHLSLITNSLKVVVFLAISWVFTGANGLVKSTLETIQIRNERRLACVTIWGPVERASRQYYFKLKFSIFFSLKVTHDLK